jgi:hypothetical protein
MKFLIMKQCECVRLWIMSLCLVIIVCVLFVVLAILPQLLEAKDCVGHHCRSKLVQNLLLKVYQSLTNLLQNFITSSKNNKVALPMRGGVDDGT